MLSRARKGYYVDYGRLYVGRSVIRWLWCVNTIHPRNLLHVANLTPLVRVLQLRRARLGTILMFRLLARGRCVIGGYHSLKER